MLIGTPSEPWQTFYENRKLFLLLNNRYLSIWLCYLCSPTAVDWFHLQLFCKYKIDSYCVNTRSTCVYVVFYLCLLPDLRPHNTRERTYLICVLRYAELHIQRPCVHATAEAVENFLFLHCNAELYCFSWIKLRDYNCTSGHSYHLAFYLDVCFKPVGYWSSDLFALKTKRGGCVLRNGDLERKLVVALMNVPTSLEQMNWLF